jgi:Ca2+-binding RTX toxin-like protein
MDSQRAGLRAEDDSGVIRIGVNTLGVEYALNNSPTDISSSTTSFAENLAANSAVASFTTTDPDIGNTFIYSLVPGAGSTDNAAFTISGKILLINSSPNFEAQSSYTVRLRSTDQDGLFTEKAFLFNVQNLVEVPTGISSSAANFNENIPVNTVVASLSTAHPDALATFVYSLITGAGDADNAAFTISGNQLLITSSPNFEVKASYAIRLRSTDQWGRSTEKALTFGVNNLNETPTDIISSTTSFNENISANSSVATFSTTDPDVGNIFSYDLVAGSGDVDNTAFAISGNQLLINASPNLATKSSYSVRIRTTDGGGLYTEKNFTYLVNDITPPTVTSITTQGTTVILKFSEAVTALSVPASAFVVATVSTANVATTRTISTIALDPTDTTRVILSLTGATLASNVNLRISYTDPAGNQITGVIQDLSGNDASSFSNRFADTFISSSTSILASQYQNLVLTGIAAINGTGNTINNIITGNTGNNSLDGGVGADSMTGGLGNDIYVVDNVGDVVTEAASEGTDTVQSSITYILGANLENLTLTGTAAVNGTGNALNNIITGNTGNNILDGGAGADSMTGGLGNDIYVVDHIGDTVIENVNEGTDTVQSSIAYALGVNLENLTLTGTTAINGTGNTLNNTITGNTGNNSLDGGAGADSMTGGLGDDTYVVDNVGDAVTEAASEGTDTVQSSITYALGVNLENLTLTGTTAINGTGNALNNIITGNTGNNSLDGGAGADSMTGGLGDDTYVVDDMGDMVIENVNEGTDTVQSSITCILGANLENLTLTGTAAINGTGNESNNALTGNSAENILIGGLGDDTYVVDNVGDTVIENVNEGTDTVQSSITYILGANLENLTLTGTTAINGTGNDSNNIITGNTGNNSLDGGAGADSMTGGLGNDIYVVDNVGDVVTEAASEGTDTVQSSITYILGANLENLTLTGTTAINGTGNALNNIITGNTGNNILDGGAGADSMTGGLGNDIYVVDNVGDVVTEAATAGSDTVQSFISYAFGVNLENLTLTGTTAINGTGNDSNNIITGNTGNNSLDGGAGADSMTGGLGNDIYVVDNVGDVVTEAATAGSDTVQSSITYALGANLENLTLTGAAAVNGTGNTLNNVLVGNSVANILSGGAGADLLTGLGGPDTFRYAVLSDSRLAAIDQITDFAIGTDILDGPTAVTAANTKELGAVATLDQAGISAVLSTVAFGSNQAATFTFGSGIGARTFLALNDATAGFSGTSDGLIEITGYTGLLTNLSII